MWQGWAPLPSLCLSGLLPSYLWGLRVRTGLERGSLAEVWIRPVLFSSVGGASRGWRKIYCWRNGHFPSISSYTFPLFLSLSFSWFFISASILGPLVPIKNLRRKLVKGWGKFLEREYISLDFQKQVTWVSWEERHHDGEYEEFYTRLAFRKFRWAFDFFMVCSVLESARVRWSPGFLSCLCHLLAVLS